MLDVLKSLAGPIIVFGLVIFVHELGHFLAAKLMGVYAPRFSIGFGPALWRKRRGETEYILAALPLGGYVRMASREDEATAFLEGGGERQPPATVGGSGEGKLVDETVVSGRSPRRDFDPEAMVPFGPKPVPEDRWFESKSLPARLFIMLAGVSMNIVLAVMVMIGVVAAYGRPVVPTRVIGAVRPPATAPTLAQEIAPGDSILAVNGVPVANWSELQRRLADHRGPIIVLTTNRRTIELPVNGGRGPSAQEVAAALVPYMPPVISTVADGSPARRAGVLPGDSVVAAGGAPIYSWQDLVERIERASGQALTLEVVRGGERLALGVTPEATEVTDPRTGRKATVGRIGVGVRDITAREAVSFPEAVSTGWNATWVMSGLIVEVLRGLLTGQVSVENLGGPIMIASVSAEAARTGLETLLMLLALLSINVAIFNLLPIPILDGGQILLTIVEAAKGSAFSARTREYILRAGLLAIALLFIIVMWNDIARILRNFG